MIRYPACEMALKAMNRLMFFCTMATTLPSVMVAAANSATHRGPRLRRGPCMRKKIWNRKASPAALEATDR